MLFLEECRQETESWKRERRLYHDGAAAVFPGDELPARTKKEQQVRWMLRIFEAVTISGCFFRYDRPDRHRYQDVSALLAFFRRACLTQIGQQRQIVKCKSIKMPTSQLHFVWEVVEQVRATLTHVHHNLVLEDEVWILLKEFGRTAKCFMAGRDAGDSPGQR